jgi:hypothetical protein
MSPVALSLITPAFVFVGSLFGMFPRALLDALRCFWDKLREAGTLRSDSGLRLKAVGIPFLQGGEDVNPKSPDH